MNTSTRGLIDRLFVKILHRNKNNTDIDDIEALVYLNEATREVFRWFSLYMPTYVRQRYEYKAIGGEALVSLPTPAVLIQSLHVNGKEFLQDGDMVPHRHCLKEFLFRLESFTDIVFPHRTIKKDDVFTVTFTPAELLELATHDTQEAFTKTESAVSLFPQMWDDALISHSMISYEAARGMMQDSESAQRAKWQAQLMLLFADAIPPTSVGEYYQSYAPRGDML